MKIPGAPHILRLKTTTSTQNAARRLAEAGAPSGTLVLAERQTRGRGRLARAWSSGKGGLYFSWLVRPQMTPRGLGRLSLNVGHALARAIKGVANADVAVKLPNDILLRPAGSQAAPKKVAGILIEAAAVGAHLDWVVIGIGVNVANRLPKGLAGATTLRAVGGDGITIPAALTAVMRELRKVPGLSGAR